MHITLVTLVHSFFFYPLLGRQNPRHFLLINKISRVFIQQSFFFYPSSSSILFFPQDSFTSRADFGTVLIIPNALQFFLENFSRMHLLVDDVFLRRPHFSSRTHVIFRYFLSFSLTSVFSWNTNFTLFFYKRCLMCVCT